MAKNLTLRVHLRPDALEDKEGKKRRTTTIDQHDLVIGLVAAGIEPVSIYANDNNFVHFAFLNDEIFIGENGNKPPYNSVMDATLGVDDGPIIPMRNYFIANKKVKGWFSLYKNPA